MPGRDTDTALRVVHDLTQSIWFGGALMGTVALDGATSTAPDHDARIRGLDRAWSRWQRVSTPAIAAHVISGIGLTFANRGRLTVQAGGGRTVAIRSALTVLALATEATTRRLGRQLSEHSSADRTEAERLGLVDTDRVGVDDTDRVGVVDDTTRGTQRKLVVAQWANVLATAAMIGVGSRMGEQQRPRELLRGVATRLGLAT